MCCGNDKKDKTCCRKPENLKDKPATCTPEQIRQCHGDEGQHPCTSDNAQ